MGSREGEKMGKKLSEIKRRRLEKMSLSLASTFVWGSSKKGYEYWRGVWDELERIAETGEP